MAKLNISLNVEFETDPFLVTKNFEEISLNKEEGTKLFSKVPVEELTFEVISANEEASASFPFGLKQGKKGAVFTASLTEKGNTLHAVIKGDFSVDLRAGVVSSLKSVGSDLDLRIRGIMWQGGAYKGFMACVKGGDYSQDKDDWANTFIKVDNFSIK